MTETVIYSYETSHPGNPCGVYQTDIQSFSQALQPPLEGQQNSPDLQVGCGDSTRMITLGCQDNGHDDVNYSGYL